MSVPDTVRKRQFPATGKWVAVEVFDSNWDRSVQGVVDPAGQLVLVYDGFAPSGTAQDYVGRTNMGN